LLKMKCTWNPDNQSELRTAAYAIKHPGARKRRSLELGSAVESASLSLLDSRDITPDMPYKTPETQLNPKVEVGTLPSIKETFRSDLAGLKEIVCQWVNLLLLLTPLALGPWGFNVTEIFFLNLIVLIPLSQLLSDATEQLVAGMGNASLGALINASLGNATEMIVTVTSLQAGLYDVVKSAMLGSILNNLLFVLGVTIMAAGSRGNQIVFGVQELIFSCSLLLRIHVICAANSFFRNQGKDTGNGRRAFYFSLLVSRDSNHIRRVCHRSNASSFTTARPEKRR